MPGIFAELELLRYTRQVSSKIVDVESKIFALDFESVGTEGLSREELEKRHEEKRNTWLDMTYLRNSLITTNVQNEKMSKHAVDVGKEFYDPVGHRTDSRRFSESEIKLAARSETSDTLVVDQICSSPIEYTQPGDSDTIFSQRMRQVGKKIELRLNTICEEYDAKIRDCTMRVDGMAMATQWVIGSTTIDSLPLTFAVTQRNSCGDGFGHESRVEGHEVDIASYHGFPPRDIFCSKVIHTC
jgi:hypothetical protein